MPNQPFIMFDGIDGSGKSTLVQAFVDALAEGGKKVFNLGFWSTMEKRLPLLAECGAPDIFLSAEPTQVWVGAAIRQELIRQGTEYDPRIIAEAYALDRLILYHRLILPLRAQGITIVSDRGISTSLAYQLQTGVTEDVVTKLSGNALALANPPTLLVIADCGAERALERLIARGTKRDDSIFERASFLESLNARYHSDAFRAIWKKCGTDVLYVNTDIPLEKMRSLGTQLAAKVMEKIPT